MKKVLISIVCILTAFFISKSVFESSFTSGYGVSDIELVSNSNSDLELDVEKEIWALNSSLNNKQVDTFIPFPQKEEFSENFLDKEEYAKDFDMMCLYRNLIMNRMADKKVDYIIKIQANNGFEIKYPFAID